jgi:ferrous iron transport protein B
MKLSELKTGERAVIVKVTGHGSFRKRIIEMGFVRGNKVRVILNAPLKDPIEYEIIGYKISLRREEADKIEVISESEAKVALEQKEDLSALPADPSDGRLIEQMENLADKRRREIRVALVGNPNCGKTSLFNFASGSHEHVGNYSGVTVDAKEGSFEHGGYKFIIVDLPGTYSLSTYSPEELYVRKHLIEETPDIVVNVVDASNLQRNLYLTTQLIDMDLRVVLALNMYDELLAKGDHLDITQFGYLLGSPVVPTVSRTGEGIPQLLDTIVQVYEKSDPKLARHIHINHGSELEQSIRHIKDLIKKNSDIRFKYSTRLLAIKYLEGDKEVEDVVEKLTNRDEIIACRFKQQQRIHDLLGVSAEAAIIDAKYAFIQGALAETYTPHKGKQRPRASLSDKIDAIVTNRFLAFPIFLMLLYVVFTCTFNLGSYPMVWIEWLVEMFGEFVATTLPQGWVKELIVDGVIGGVGSVLVFLPNILILYLFISLMEDSGYMARAAFIMDKVMHKMGLHGKSFIPMIMGFGCNVPAIMATRAIESRKSRLITIMILPFMSCSGRMPVYILVAGAFFPKGAALVMLGMYAFGIMMAILSAKVMSWYIKDDDLPFVMELPPYRVPTGKSIFRHTWERGKQYLQKMSGTILICSVLIWALGYFPNHNTPGMTPEQRQENSYIGYVGKTIAPILEPLGFDWRMGVGIVAGVGAKELVVSSMGVMYGADELEDAGLVAEEGSEEIGDTILQRALQRSITPAAALAFMIFILLYFPCVATFVAIKNETNSWRWAIYSAIYTIILAWVMAFITYRLALLFF